MGSWKGWEVGKGVRVVRLIIWEMWEGDEVGMVRRKQRGMMELPLELQVPFWGIVVGKSKCGKLLR